VSVLVASATIANAEIMCTDRGGCWETGKQIRLLNNLRGIDQTLASRDGNGRVNVQGIPIANDYSHQRGPHYVPKRVK
jgi:hypothetical protein